MVGRYDNDTYVIGESHLSSTRHHIDSLILPALDNPTQWDKTLPRKVNIFMWRFMLDRLPHRLNLSSRGIDIPTIACPLCNGNVESSNHIFLGCGNAKDILNIIRNWCDIQFLLVLRLSIGSHGSIRGKRLKRRNGVYQLFFPLPFGGFGGFVIASLLVNIRLREATSMIMYGLLLSLGFIIDVVCPAVGSIGLNPL
ncbi:RNA-directed DNA polymerase, eukaryota, reverse transcriptase zinc-binding domain protein [Tanacetum coccineum]